MPKTIRVHVAMVNHEYGTTAFAARKVSELWRKVADYVAEWSGQLPGADAEYVEGLLDKGKYRKAVEEYFERKGDESLDIGDDTITL